MSINTTQGENRPSITSSDALADSHPEPFTVPLLRLRGHDRPVIGPEDCLVSGCLVCAWRKAGLLDAPHIANRVAREPSSGFTCHSSYCPGCNTVRCVCLPEGYEDVVYEHDYTLGHAHGAADGPDNRPTRRWLAEANLDADAYLGGYDDACAGLPIGMPAEPFATRLAAPVRLWDDLGDGMPF